MLRELDNQLTWDVEKKSLSLLNDSTPISDYTAIVRNDNNHILSIMKDSYLPMTNREFSTAVEKIQEISGFNLTGYNEFKQGRKVLAFLENNIEDFYIGGHKIKDYLLLGNSFDGSTSFFQGTSTILIRCQNQFSKIQVHSKIRHTKQFNAKLDEYYSYLQFYFNQRKELYGFFNQIGNVRVTEKLQEDLINFVLNIDPKTEELSTRKKNQIENLRLNILSETKDLGDNMWGAFNGITKYTTHDISPKEEVFGNVFGIQADINNRAIEFMEKQLAY